MTGIIRSRIDRKRWLLETPSVEEVRPSSCVRCGAAARPAGGPLCLHGHGVRLRQLRGPRSPGEPPWLDVLTVRRYRCQRCAAVLVVGPCDTAPRKHYAATAIALALALFGVSGQTHAEVRAQVSPSPIVGVTAERRWYTMTRWIDAVTARDLFPAVPVMPRDLCRRAVAARTAMAIGAHAPPSLPESAPVLRAFVGVAQMS